MPVPWPVRWDIFCKVIDNYGDIGVSWRLARQLAGEHGCTLRLWVDDLRSFQRLVPEIDPQRAVQYCRQIEIRHWQEDVPCMGPADVADVVIEAFGCRLPDAYVAAMVQGVEVGNRPPVWINLEYLSAEAWIESHHGLPSPHPQLPLTKYFFFPGFTDRTGGLLCEAGLLEWRQQFQSDTAAQTALWRQLGLEAALPGELRLSLFAYARPETGRLLWQLLEFWSADSRPRTLLIPENLMSHTLARFFGQAMQAGQRQQRGALTVQTFAFLDQADYDRLLWACDVNFVRGEDSFVRAQWAGRALVWQIYPQEEEAYLHKLDAYLDLHTQDLAFETADPLRQFWGIWNQTGSGASDAVVNGWLEFERALPVLTRHAQDWAGRIRQDGDLVSRLLRFVKKI